MPEAPHSIAFDYHGALELARRLTQLAERWDQAFAERQLAASSALATWTGSHRESVSHRVASEQFASDEICGALRAEADRWARAWADALDDHNRQAVLESLHASSAIQIAPAGPVEVPRGPAFTATAAAPFATGPFNAGSDRGTAR